MEQRYTFSGHESFACKTLWLKKGYEFVVEGRDFNDTDAVISLGVGKNMVASIRYWLRVFGICNNDGVTPIGRYLFDEQTGKDKFIEDLATLWLLHFNIVFNEKATLFNMFFRGFQQAHPLFKREQVLSFVKLKLAEAGKSNLFNEKTINKDIGVLLLNYVLPRKPKSNEDFSSLLLDLDLIRQDTEQKGYYFNGDGKREVTKEIFLYGLLKLKAKTGDSSITYETIQDQVGSIFCMSDGETIDMLKRLSKDYAHEIAYSDVAGIRQIQFTKDIEPMTVLDQYYENI